MARHNAFKQALAERKRQIGYWLTLNNPTAVELAAAARFDCFVIDMEHASYEVAHVLDSLRAIPADGPELMVRVPSNDPVIIKRLLDLGVRSLMIPMIQDADDAREAVAATRYPPQGIRGVAASVRATGFGRNLDYLTTAADEICIVAQIETQSALARIPEIAAVAGIDGLFIGPADLSADLGLIGQRHAPKVKETILKGVAMIRDAGKGAGFIEFDTDEAARMFDAGFTFIVVGGEAALIARGAQDLVRRFKPT